MLGDRERVLTPEGEAHRFTEACFALSSGTRMQVLQVLLVAEGALHIREIARRVGSDASPVRAHLEVLVKTGLAREIEDPSRERRFVSNVSGVRLILTPPERPAEARRDAEPTKAIVKVTEKMRGIEEKIHRLERDLVRLAEERAEMWRELSP